MSYLKRLMKQSATHWVRSGFSKHADPSFAAPVALATSTDTGVRWENRVERFTNKAGDLDQGHAVVFSAVTEFVVGDYLFLGTSVATDPETVTGADQVKYAEKIPDVKSQKYLYKAVL